MINKLESLNKSEDISVIEKKNPNMLMDVRYEKLLKDCNLVIEESSKEVAILLLDGSIKINYDDKEIIGRRSSLFDEFGIAIHASKNNKLIIQATIDSEILIQKIRNDNSFETVVYTQDNISDVEAGLGVWNNTAHRIIRTIFDYENAPYSNMVLGEVINYPGSWSSYIPHSHPQPEIYYYRFDKEQGFGASFLGDEVYKIHNHSFICIDDDKTHPQVSAPGYAMYYTWMIAHLKDNPWTDRVIDDNHAWLLKEDCEIWHK